MDDQPAAALVSQPDRLFAEAADRPAPKVNTSRLDCQFGLPMVLGTKRHDGNDRQNANKRRRQWDCDLLQGRLPPEPRGPPSFKRRWQRHMDESRNNHVRDHPASHV
jgi:hypothetical protein